MLGAATKQHSDDTTGEGNEQSMMVLIQLQSQNPPVLLTLNVTPGDRDIEQADSYINVAVKYFGSSDRRLQGSTECYSKWYKTYLEGL